jgi:hypothetical protein
MPQRRAPFNPEAVVLLCPATMLVVAVAFVAFYGCGGGGGGGGVAGGGGGGSGQKPTTFQGREGLNQFTQANPNAAAQFNNASQASRLTNRYLNQDIASNVRQSPQDTLTNTVNHLGRVDQLRNLLRQHPNLRNALQFRDTNNDGLPDDTDNDNIADDLTVDFDRLTPEDEGIVIGALPIDTKFVPVSWRQGLKLFKGRCKITDPNPNDANQPQQEVKVECDKSDPVQVTSPEPNRPKLKLLGTFKERIPNTPQGQQVQAEIDFDGLTIEDLQTRDRVELGDPQKQEWSPITLSVDPNDPLTWNFSGIDWNEVDITWLDGDMLQLATENLAGLEWTLNSEGLSGFAFDDCIIPVGGDWKFTPVPRSRRQAELLDPFVFDWLNTPAGNSCDAFTFDVSIPDQNITLDDLPETGWDEWVDTTDAELDVYLASLLKLPPGAELADAILTAEAFTTGLPQFMHDFVLKLHSILNLQTRPQGVQVTGDYPSNYAATFSGQSVELPVGTFTLSGQVAFQFQTSPQQQISATFTNFRVEEFDATLNGTLAMTLNEGPQLAVNITATNFRWEIPEVQRGSANGTMQASLTLGQNRAVAQVITSQMNLNLSVTNMTTTPPQTYNATLTVSQPLRWPVNECDFSVEGVMGVQGTIANQQVDMQVDFGHPECEKAKITSAGQSAIYNLNSGLFEELTRLKGRLRVLQLPEHKPIRFSRRAGVAL